MREEILDTACESWAKRKVINSYAVCTWNIRYPTSWFIFYLYFSLFSFSYYFFFVSLQIDGPDVFFFVCYVGLAWQFVRVFIIFTSLIFLRVFFYLFIFCYYFLNHMRAYGGWCRWRWTEKLVRFATQQFVCDDASMNPFHASWMCSG